MRTSRRVLAATVILGVAVVSATYGFLVHERHLFPYTLLARVHRALASTARSKHELHARRAEPDASLSHEELKRLGDLPYLKGYRSASGSGAIRIYDRSRSEKGMNFFTSAHAPVATLMDMEGNVVRTWTADAHKVFPGLVVDPKYLGNEDFFRDAELLPDGGILALFDQIGLVRLDAASRVVWAWRAQVHHDVVVHGQEIWTLLRERRIVPEINRNEPIFEDFAVRLSPSGKLLAQISLVDCFQKSQYAPLLKGAWGRAGDVLHTNSLMVLDGSLVDRSPSFRRGNLLVSLRSPGVIAVVDPEAKEVVWALNGIWLGQHSAQFLSNGHLLLFDNLGTLRKTSRVIELDMFTQQIVWSFGGRVGQDLWSESNGFVERLPGGNTLVTESNGGRVLEVTPDDRVVWEFVNPHRVGQDKELTAVVYFMNRVSADQPALRRPVGEGLSEPRVSPPREAPRTHAKEGTPPTRAAEHRSL